MLKRFLRNGSGATAIEYALIGSLIAVVVVGAIGATGAGTNGLYNKLGTAFSTYLP